ncbi:phosphotransferase [Nocardia transvalensis]|uniref:phosphotransferase n=1 Tax=Nocardia transvalensis TaxID=37333 RepID=UPI0018958955|nr:phosphotransferase [Nocardia transvalensis]MBF6328007.1 phosphotransferase [Nocardia transvalensis]
MEITQGWDSVTTLDDGWILRRPRRPEVTDQLRRETRLLPWLAPRLPLAVPIPEVVTDEPLVIRHRLVPGDPVAEPTAAHGRALAAFLRALHACPADEAQRRGLPSAAPVVADRAATFERFRAQVVPMVPGRLRPAALALLDAAADLPADTVVHGDLGPEHVLADADGLTGVIDFGDSHLGDPAVDLAWALHDTPDEFARALAETYGVTAAQRARSGVWYRLGPWHEVTFGLDTADPEYVRSGLDGVLRRL